MHISSIQIHCNNMKNIIDIINEGKDDVQYFFTSEEKKSILDFTNKFINDINRIDIVPKKLFSKGSEYEDSKLHEFFKYDFIRFSRTSLDSSATSYGDSCKYAMSITADSIKIPLDYIAAAYESVFNDKITESILDSDEEIDKKAKEYTDIIEYFKNLKQTIEKTFDSKPLPKKLSYELFSKKDFNNKKYPSTEIGDIHYSIWSFSVSYYKDRRFELYIGLTVYKLKDQDQIEKEKAERAAIAAAKAAVKPLDCCGREIHEGDTVAYAMTKNFTGNGLSVSKVYSVARAKVSVDDGMCDSARCCIVSRKDGKMIE